MTATVAILVLVSAGLHAAWNFAARAVKGNQVVLWLSLGLAGVVSLPAAVVFLFRAPPQAAGWLYLTGSCVLDAAFFILLGKAYEQGEISLVYPVARGSGIACAALLALGLGVDTIAPVGGAGIAAVCGGVLLIGLGHDGGAAPGHKLHAVVLALLTGAALAGFSILDKLGVGFMHPVIYVWGQYLGTFLFMLPYSWPRARGRLRATWREFPRAICFIGPASLVTYLLILFAFQLGSVSAIVAFREFAVVLGCLLGFCVLKERLTVRKALGIAAIVLGLLLIKL